MWMIAANSRRTHSASRQGRSQDFEFRGLKPMASAERQPITGVWGQSPQRGQGQSPPEAERVLAVGRPVEAANFPHSMHF